jgi:hypothetical protein
MTVGYADVAPHSGGFNVSKKKPAKPKATLYVEIDAQLKGRIDRIAELHGRKIVAEVTRALEFYLAAHEPKAGAGKE